METHKTAQPSFGGESEIDHNPQPSSPLLPHQSAHFTPTMTEDEHTSASSPIPPFLNRDLPPPKLDLSAPPPYEMVAELPTYEEVEKERTKLGELKIKNPSNYQNPQALAFLAVDTEGHDIENESELLGTDFMFFTAFLVAFLFNWIGFLLVMCFCNTIAARYGALSGFGLSLAKWTFIVKHSTDLASRENSWLWWLIMAFGVLLFVRGITQYLSIKREWRFLSGAAQERLFFFY